MNKQFARATNKVAKGLRRPHFTYKTRQNSRNSDVFFGGGYLCDTHPFSVLRKHPGSTTQNFCKPLRHVRVKPKCAFWLHPRRCVRMAKMQGAEDEGAGSVLKYMTKPESDSNAADWLL